MDLMEARGITLMRATLGVLALMSVLSLSAQEPETPKPLVVKINPAQTWGRWEGWGTSLCWMGKVFGARDDVADLLFTTKTVDVLDQKLPGLGLNIVRYNAGAGSWNEIDGRRMQVSKIILPYRQIEGFWLDGKSADPQSWSWNWQVDANQRAMLQKAKERGADRFELFSNSPMWWMCDNDNPSGSVDKTKDNLPAKNYPAFATYLATIARRAKDHWGIAFSSVEPFNEGSSGYWFADCKQEGTQFNPPAQATFLPFLRAELDRQGLKGLPIAASDESRYDQALEAWNAFSPEVKALVAKVNVHGYQYAKGNRAELYRRVVIENGKILWNSEHGDSLADGLEMARNIHRDMATLHPTAWCYWQPFDGGGWGMIDADMPKEVLKKVNPKFFVIAQYSRHIREGMAILDSGEAKTIAAYDSAAHKLVLVTLNDGPARTITYDLSAFSAPDGSVTSVLTEPLGQARYRIAHDQVLRQKRLSAPFPAHSIQTFEIENVSQP